MFCQQEQMGLATPAERMQLAEHKARTSSRLLAQQDPNGFRKLLVTLSVPAGMSQSYCMIHARAKHIAHFLLCPTFQCPPLF